MLSFKPFPLLESEHLILRKMTLADKQPLFQIRSDSRMHTHTDTKPDATLRDTEAYIERMLKGIEDSRWIIWAIEHKPSQAVIGTISIWNIDVPKMTAELAYGIVPEFQGQGLMKEALKQVISFGFQTLRLNTLEAYTEQSNLPSRKLLETCGFQETGQIDEKGSQVDRTFQMVIYQLKNGLSLDRRNRNV